MYVSVSVPQGPFQNQAVTRSCWSSRTSIKALEAATRKQFIMAIGSTVCGLIES